MERKLLERMVGAAALIALLVVIGPFLLDGNSNSPVHRDAGAGPEDLQTRTVTLRARGDAARPVAAADQGGSPGSTRPAIPPPAIPAAPQALPAQASPPQPPPSRADTGPARAASVQPVAVTPVPRSTEKASEPAPLKPIPPPSTQPSAEGWVVQIGTFSDRGNAERLTHELTARGFSAFVSPVSRTGKTFYRVRVGPAGERAAAEDLARKLAIAGHAGPVVPSRS
jgi:cell division septation protein DedD